MRFSKWRSPLDRGARFGLAIIAFVLAPAAAFAEPQKGDKVPDAKPAETKPADAKPADKTDKPAENAKPAEKGEAKPADKGAPKTEKAPAAEKTPTLTASNLQLRDVMAKTDELKIRIRDTRSSLTSVSDEVFKTDTGGARTELVLTNEMSSAYRLQRVVLLLDNAKVADRTDEGGSLADVKSVPMFTGLLTPGDHAFTLQLVFKGHGYGVFKYLEGYTFNVKSTHAVTASNLPIHLTVNAFEKGDQSTALDQRPTVEWKDQNQVKK